MGTPWPCLGRPRHLGINRTHPTKEETVGAESVAGQRASAGFLVSLERLTVALKKLSRAQIRLQPHEEDDDHPDQCGRGDDDRKRDGAQGEEPEVQGDALRGVGSGEGKRERRNGDEGEGAHPELHATSPAKVAPEVAVSRTCR